MNGKTAKKLRRIARELALTPADSYQPVGPEIYVEAKVDHGRSYTAGIKRRPLALGACERRAYLEAKAIYKGQVAPVVGKPQKINPEEYERAYRDRMVDSIGKQNTDAV